MSRAWLAATAASLVLAAGCATGQPGELTVAAQRQLVAKVQQVRDTAATGTYAELSREVRQLKTLVERLHANGQVTDARFSAIEDAADALLTDARPAPATPAPVQSSASPTHSSTPTQSSSPTASSSPAPSQTQTQSQSPEPTTTISVP